MDFELSDEQRLLTDSARAFAARELAPHAADWDREHHFPVEVIRRAAEQGYLALYIGEEDGGRWAELNWQLHACLYEPAQRPFLVGLIRSIHDKLERYLRMQMSLSEGKDRADHEHREIIAACRAGDADTAARLIETHINGVCQTLYEHLPNRL